MVNTIEVVEACLAIPRIEDSIDEMKTLLNKQNQLLEELIKTLKDNKEGGMI